MFTAGRRILTLAVAGATVLTVALLPLTQPGAVAAPQGPARPAELASGSPVASFVLPTPWSGPMDVAAGPGGTLWVTEYDANKVARLTVTGSGVSIQEFWVPTSASQPQRIAKGPDGNMWFTESGAQEVSKITPAGAVTSYAWPLFNAATDMVSGPDGNLWVPGGTADKISRLTTGGTVTEYPVTAGRTPVEIAAGPDGNLWVTEAWGNRVAKLTTGGGITEYPMPTAASEPRAITAGPDGNLWVVEMAGDNVARVTPDGEITEYALPSTGSRPWGITAGPDGNLWVSETNFGQLARVTPDGEVTEYALDPGTRPLGLAAGPDDCLWVVVRNTNSLLRINLVSTVAFSAPATAVQENVGTALLTVTRTGETSGPSTVHYARTGGTATPGADFTLLPGALTFAAGQLTRTIAVPVVNDALREGPETVVLTLSGASPGARLGSPVSTTLTIRASDQRPDGWISTASASGYVGNNVYNTTSAGQTRTTNARRSQARTFYARVYNDGNVVNTFTVQGSGVPTGAWVRYYRGTSDVTSSLRSAAGWKVSVAPGRYVLVRFVIHLSATAGIGTTKGATVTATWAGDGTRIDRVRGAVHVVR